MFAGKDGAYPSEAPFRCSILGYAPGLTHKHQIKLERLAFSLLQKSANYSRKKVYSTGLWTEVFTTLYPLQSFITPALDVFEVYRTTVVSFRT
jgi:hypothetical protein